MSFTVLGLSDNLLKNLESIGYQVPSPIQCKAIPVVLQGKDVVAAAQTGTGKTASFVLPMIDRLLKGPYPKANQTRSLILVPTRELAAQVGESVAKYAKNLDLKYAVVFGGVKVNPQMMKLRSGTDILIATPGRLLDLYQQNAVKFNELEILVLDEADRMLDMGFIHDIKKIINLVPKKRQNLMFSATFSPEIRELAKKIVHCPEEISVDKENTTAVTVQQFVYPVDKHKKSDLLIKIINEQNLSQVLVFSKTKHGANKLTKKLITAGINSAAIHGNKSQGARTTALANFKNGTVRVLVATDIASRGLDIHMLPQVINFDLPNIPEDYVHRIGRTGRAGADGIAISLVCHEEFKELQAMERLIKQELSRKLVSGYEPTKALPRTRF